MPDDRKSILLRIPPELWDSLSRWARDELRSVNAQIEYVLRDAVARREGHPASRADQSGRDTGARKPKLR